MGAASRLSGRFVGGELELVSTQKYKKRLHRSVEVCLKEFEVHMENYRWLKVT